MIPIQDFATDESGDLLIRNGDFVLENSEQKHIEKILIGQKGWLRFSPLLGAELMLSINSPSSAYQAQVKKARLNLEFDGMKVQKCEIMQGQNNSVSFDIQAKFNIRKQDNNG